MAEGGPEPDKDTFNMATASKSLNSLDVRSSFSSSSIGETESQSGMPCMSKTNARHYTVESHRFGHEKL